MISVSATLQSSAGARGTLTLSPPWPSRERHNGTCAQSPSNNASMGRKVLGSFKEGTESWVGPAHASLKDQGWMHLNVGAHIATYQLGTI